VRPLLLLALWAGCSARPLDPGAADLASVDATSPANQDLAICGNRHVRTHVPLVTLATLDGKSSFPMGAALRLLVSFPLRERCDVAADIVVEPLVGGTTMGLDVSAYTWLGTSGCDATTLVTRVVTIPSNLIVGSEIVLRDSKSVNGLSLTLSALAGPSPACNPGGIGSLCKADCDCGGDIPGTLCLVGTDGFYRCGLPCHSDTQCRDLAPNAGCDNATTWSCGILSRCINSDEDCEFGERAEQCRCTRPRSTSQLGRCGCDAECPAGSLCLEGGYCARTCTGPDTCADTCSGPSCEVCIDGLCSYVL